MARRLNAGRKQSAVHSLDKLLEGYSSISEARRAHTEAYYAAKEAEDWEAAQYHAVRAQDLNQYLLEEQQADAEYAAGAGMPTWNRPKGYSASRRGAGRKVADASGYAAHYDELAVIIRNAEDVSLAWTKMYRLMEQTDLSGNNELAGAYGDVWTAILDFKTVAQEIMEADRAATRAELEAEGL